MAAHTLHPIQAMKRQIEQSQLTAEEKAAILGRQLQNAQNELGALQSEYSHLARLAGQLGEEAKQKELCDIVAIEVMAKGEDLAALENDVYLLEMFVGEGEQAHISNNVTFNTLKEMRSYLEAIVAILNRETFSNPSTESQRLSLSFCIADLLEKTLELQRRVAVARAMGAPTDDSLSAIFD